MLWMFFTFVFAALSAYLTNRMLKAERQCNVYQFKNDSLTRSCSRELQRYEHLKEAADRFAKCVAKEKSARKDKKGPNAIVDAQKELSSSLSVLKSYLK